MFSIFTRVMSRVTHSEPGLAMSSEELSDHLKSGVQSKSLKTR